MRRIFSILTSLLFLTQLYAGQEQYSSRIEGADVYIGATYDLYDAQYFEMNTNPSWDQDFTNYRVNNKVTLGLNPEVIQQGVFTSEVEVEVTYQIWNNGAFQTIVENRTLVVNYDDAVPTTQIDDLSSFVFEGAHFIHVEVINITGANASDLFLESSVDIERYYSFDGTQVSGGSYSFSGANGLADYIEFNWDTKAGAEFYEVEWVHINDYTIDDGVYISSMDLKYDFYLNSTRVTTKNNWYKIPKIFDHGYVLFRIRAVGMQGNDFSHRYNGEWDGLEKGIVANFPLNRSIAITSEYDGTMNWAHQVGYTEDGKRFEGVSFMDGLGRGRQSVSHNTETQQAVVSNVYYDEMGRPAVSDLPTPVDGEHLKHYPEFNRSELDPNEAFRVDYFDDPNAINDPSCSETAAGFSTTHGAGQYYSSSNPDLTGGNAHIPDAEKFPFSRVTYLDDFTNRPLKISGFGDDLKIGSGHETKMIYVSPNQLELDKLFGSEVGDYSHYQKMITIDANGQAYAQYTDMAGRVVASYMIGPAPSNLEALANNIVSISTVDLLVNGSSQTVENDPPSASVTHYEYFPEDDTYTLNYGFTPEQYQSTCLPANICLDCVYDLTISIEDECGVSAFSQTIQINGATFDEICDGQAHVTNQQVTLTAGRYSIEKTLSVNQDAIAQYWCSYINNTTCLTSLSDHFNNFYLNEDFIECQDELYEEDLSSCEVSELLMLEDLMPGGQYALYNTTASGYTITDPASQTIFGTEAGGNWMNGTYLNEDGSTYTVSTLEDFIDNYRKEWAAELLDYHPEKCYLDFCTQSASSDAYNDGMLATDEYTTALGNGYFKPLASPYLPAPGILGSANSTLDPFFNGGQGATQQPAMGNFMLNYTIVALDGTTTTVSMWDYAIMLATGLGPFATANDVPTDLARNWVPDGCDDDLVWINFRNLYLEAKTHYYFEAQQAHATANGCSNECIGSDDPSCPNPNNFEDKVSRFGNANVSFGTSTTSINDLLNSATPVADVQNLAADICQKYAHQSSLDWMNLLSGCDFVASSVDTALLRADMVALISSACDENNPQGASTTPNPILTSNNNTSVSSLEELLTAYSLTETNLCSDLLISSPGVYQTAEQSVASIEKPLDVCACDAVLEARDLAALTSNTFTVEEALQELTGLDMADIDQLICACEAEAPSWGKGYTWAQGSNANLALTELSVPASISCEECSVECTDVNADLATLETRFTAVTDFSSAVNYETILTNYLNQQYGYSLAYEDYAAFIGKCGATSTNPYCAVTQEISDWAEMMTLVAFRGQLLNDDTAPVDLSTNNIVYQNNELYFEGNNYWSSLSGTTLTTHFGETGNNCSVDLTTTIDFASIVSFGAIVPTSTVCPSSNTFQIEVQYIDCGEIKTALIDGASNCFNVVECICDPTGLVLCDDLQQIYTGPCYEPRLSELYQNAVEAYKQGVSDAYLEFSQEYNEACAQAFDTENFNYTGNFREYQYTLFYYDQAGNLIKTIAPEGVNKLTGTALANVSTARASYVDENNPGTAELPNHDYQTTYEYNSYNQLAKTTNPDQDGDTKFWYDRYGRIVASQNPVQALELMYSYSLYDAQGRPEEVGQVSRKNKDGQILMTPFTDADIKQDDLGAWFENWVYTGIRSEVTITTYDKYPDALTPTKFTVTPAVRNLRLRVSAVRFYKGISGSTDLNTDYESATYYAYDRHGNVQEQIQDVPALAVVGQDQKSTQYEYELISGNVEKVKYQEDELDAFTHEYEYDELNRLTEVFTTSDNVHKTREAHYHYYDYGPLARTELGQHKVQGQDFAYTINGWLKAMNGSTLSKTNDIGKDGNGGYLSGNTSAHSLVARDVNAYTIGYFDGDYAAIGASTMEITSIATDPFRTQSNDLYNGNIRHLVTSIYELGTLGTVYSYDQLQRLTEMTAFKNTNTNNTWSGIGSTQEYYNAYTYDKNGNILTLKRNGTLTGGLLMDDMTYSYTTVQGGLSNRLDHVVDTGTDYRTFDPNKNDFGDIVSGTDQSGSQYTSLIAQPGNFQYDELGQLIADPSEEIASMKWRKGDKKLLSLTRTPSSMQSDLEFVYNPFGIRILKIEKTKVSGGFLAPQEEWKYTYYSHDANGQTMAVYDLTMSNEINRAYMEEHHIYGATRLGMLKEGQLIYDNGAVTPPNTNIVNNTLGDRRYELTNHLGNVQAVITDRKTWNATDVNYEAVVVMTSDYYPFGMQMPERHNQYGPDGDYRYAYNGMETDNEVSGNGNSYTTEFRQYDPRLGRWKSLDPLMAMFPHMSPYCAFDNNPVFYVDPYGLSATNHGGPPDNAKEGDTWTNTESGKSYTFTGGSWMNDDYLDLAEVTVSSTATTFKAKLKVVVENVSAEIITTFESRSARNARRNSATNNWRTSPGRSVTGQRRYSTYRKHSSHRQARRHPRNQSNRKYKGIPNAPEPFPDRPVHSIENINLMEATTNFGRWERLRKEFEEDAQAILDNSQGEMSIEEIVSWTNGGATRTITGSKLMFEDSQDEEAVNAADDEYHREYVKHMIQRLANRGYGNGLCIPCVNETIPLGVPDDILQEVRLHVTYDLGLPPSELIMKKILSNSPSGSSGIIYTLSPRDKMYPGY